MRCIGFFLFFQCSAFAFSPLYIHNIDQEALKEYVSTIPDPQAQEWVEKHASFLGYLARIPYPLSSWPAKFNNGEWCLYEQGINNYGYTNFIFQIPDSEYWIQIGGPKHRVRNLYMYNTRKNSYWYTEILKHWELRNSSMLDAFEIVSTFQTISRFAYYILLEKALDEFNCEYVHIAPTYLVHIPGYSTSMCDEHYIVVQKHIEGLTRLRDAPERIKKVPNAAIQELFNVICATGYWNIKNGLYITTNNHLVLLDYEQRNIENPKDFFFKDLQAFEECVFNGIQELALFHLKPHAPKAYNQLLWLIATDATLPHFSTWPKYMQLLGHN